MLYGVGGVHRRHGPRMEIKGNYADLILFSHLYLGLELRASGLAEDAFLLNHLTSPTPLFSPMSLLHHSLSRKKTTLLQEDLTPNLTNSNNTYPFWYFSSLK